MIVENFDLTTFLEDLEHIVNIDSKTYDLDNILKISDFFTNKFNEIGCKVKLLETDKPESPILKAVNSTNDSFDFLLVGHMDTVFPRGTVKERPFKIEGNYAFGPGVCDMKSGLLVAFHIMKLIRESVHDKKINVCVLFNSEEETGSLASTEIIKEIAKKSKYAFVLEPGKPGFTYVTQRKGTAKFKITFKGISAHAGSSPEKGKSAITEMAHFITRTDNLNDFATGTTLNTGIVSGGTAANVVASEAEMILDLRFSSITEYKRLLRTLTEMTENPVIKGIKIKNEQISFRSPMNPTKDTFVIMHSLEELAGKNDVKVNFENSGGVSDGNTISSLGIPVIDSCGPIGSNAHNENEYIEIDSIEKRMYLLWMLMKTLSEKNDLS